MIQASVCTTEVFISAWTETAKSSIIPVGIKILFCANKMTRQFDKFEVQFYWLQIIAMDQMECHVL